EIIREVERALGELPEREDVVERLTEVVRERPGVTADELRDLVEEAVADYFRSLGVDDEVARRAAAGDPEAVREAVRQVRAEAAADVERLATEFDEELERLGARVSRLENLFGDLEDRVDRVEREFAEWRHDRRTKFSGSVGIEVDVTAVPKGDSREYDNRY